MIRNFFVKIESFADPESGSIYYEATASELEPDCSICVNSHELNGITSRSKSSIKKAVSEAIIDSMFEGP